MIIRSILSLALGAAAMSGFAQANNQFFSEVKGEKEFTRTMIARPLPFQDALKVTGDAAGARKLIASARSLAKAFSLRYYDDTDEYIVAVPFGMTENQFANLVLRGPGFQYVEPNWRVFPTRTPNDPLFGQQWHHPQINSPQAWDLITGSTTLVTAFTDTGVDKSHPDLSASLVSGYNAVDQIAEVDGGKVNDVHGHGTHVAGCISAIGNNGGGVAGVGWGFKLMPVRVSNDSGGGSTIEILTRGARWAADNGAKVISASYSGVDAPAIETTGQYIRGKGALYLYAAGNDGRNLNGFDHLNVIVVGASDRGDVKAGFSAYGKAVDVFAPGVDILSTVRGGGYEAWSGTSMATPLANGACAMIWSANPYLTPGQVEQVLSETSKDLGAPGNDDFWGWGRIDVYAAVKRAMITVTIKPTP